MKNVKFILLFLFIVGSVSLANKAGSCPPPSPVDQVFFMDNNGSITASWIERYAGSKYTVTVRGNLSESRTVMGGAITIRGRLQPSQSISVDVYCDNYFYASGTYIRPANGSSSACELNIGKVNTEYSYAWDQDHGRKHITLFASHDAPYPAHLTYGIYVYENSTSQKLVTQSSFGLGGSVSLKFDVSRLVESLWVVVQPDNSRGHYLEGRVDLTFSDNRTDMISFEEITVGQH